MNSCCSVFFNHMDLETNFADVKLFLKETHESNEKISY